MSKDENDPDILQLLDERNVSWVKSWLRAANKLSRQRICITTLVSSKETLCPEQANI